MNASSIALFLHIVGALGFFVALGLEWTGLREIRGAALPEQVRAWMGILKNTTRLGIPSMLTLLITGVYMVMTDVGWVAWILVVLGALVLAMALSMVFTRPRMAAIGQALAREKSPVSPSFRSVANHPVLWISIQTRAAIALGIVFLKIAQPDLGGSLLVIGISIFLGVLSALPLSRGVKAHAGSTD
jgi:hypothetical protein